MTAKRNDLLSVTRAMVRLAQVVTIVLMAVAAVILIGLLNGAGKPLPTFTGKLAQMDPKAAMIALRVGAIGGLVAAATLLPLMQQLIRIIDSARLGDPFVPENARRLRLIGWLFLAFNFCVNSTISAVVRGGITFPFVSLSAALMVLLIFVLARIFGKGSEMRAELKETI